MACLQCCHFRRRTRKTPTTRILWTASRVFQEKANPRRRRAMKLYGFGPTRSLRALWGLNEVGVDFELEVVNLLAGEHQRPEFMRLNPAGKLPVLVDGDLVIPESAAIVLYLAEKHPQSRLLPADLKARAEVYRWVMFAMTELEPPLWRITRHTALLPQEKRLPHDV